MMQSNTLLSIHQNYYASTNQRGAQVFFLKEDEQDELLAKTLQEQLNALYQKEGAKARKIMPAEYFILTCAPCPAVLIECGFLSNPKDEALLCSDYFIESLAENICIGVIEYLFSQV